MLNICPQWPGMVCNLSLFSGPRYPYCPPLKGVRDKCERVMSITCFVSRTMSTLSWLNPKKKKKKYFFLFSGKWLPCVLLWTKNRHCELMRTMIFSANLYSTLWSIILDMNNHTIQLLPFICINVNAGITVNLVNIHIAFKTLKSLFHIFSCLTTERKKMRATKLWVWLQW